MQKNLLSSERLRAGLPARALDSGADVQRPAYDRATLEAGVVHLGLGAFHRAHQAIVFDGLLARGDRRWGVCGIAMRSTALADALAAQDGLYAVRIASAQGLRWQVPGALLRTRVASRERAQVVAAMAAAPTRWITLTVTEKGYVPELAALIVDGLAARRDASLPGLTIASCDNLSDNGRKLQALCLADARARDTALAQWIDARCAFPNSMVDRIVPAATAAQREAAAAALGVADEGALGTEAFWEWVLERRLAEPADAEALAALGVTMVGEVKPFEDAKLRMLNGSHSAIALMGAVQGWETVSDGIAREPVRRFVHAYMTQAVMPTLTRPGLAQYRDALIERFGNPHLRHRVHQIATDSSLKIALRWPPVIREALAAGRPIELSAFACAVWMRYLDGVDEAGRAYALDDPQAGPLQAIARAHAGDVDALVQALLGFEPMWGTDLQHDARWAPRVAHWLRRIRADGLAAALDEVTR